MIGLRAVIKRLKWHDNSCSIKQAQLKENVSFAGAETIEWGLQVARNATLSSFVVQTYYQEVANLVNNTKGSRIGICWIITKIQNQKRNLKEVKFIYVFRACNVCANSLGKYVVGPNTSTV